MRGDVNGDGVVDISDVTKLIDMLFGIDEVSEVADCNLDSEINITDVTTLIDFLLYGGWPN